MKRTAILLLLLMACTSQEDILTVGVIGPLSGSFAYFGEQEQRGVELAVQELAEKGIVIETIYEDSEATHTKTISAYRKLVDLDGVDFVIGDAWGTTEAIVPIANERKSILISPVASQTFLSEDDFFFRTMTPVKGMMEALADHTFNELGIRAVAILAGRTSYGEDHAREFTKAFEALGGEIVAQESFAYSDTDYRPQITKIMQKQPEAVLNLHGGQLFGLIVKQATDLGFETVWLGHLGVENGPLLTVYGDLLDEKVYFPLPFAVETVDAEFAERFRTTYNEEPNFIAFNAFQAVMLLHEAIEEVGMEDEAIKNYFDNSGKFNAEGDMINTIYIKTIDDGEFITT